MNKLKQLFLQILTFAVLFHGITSRMDESLPPSFPSGTGYTNIDCGVNESNTQQNYKSDAEFIDTGINTEISASFTNINTGILPGLRTLRYFPEGKRNCYTIKVENGGNIKYLIRAQFLYGNYDGLNLNPKFDLYIGVNFWVNVVIKNATTITMSEIIHKPDSDFIHVCLVNTNNGTPFISALVVRPLSSSIYNTNTASASASLKTVRRYATGTNRQQYPGLHSFGGDVYDRVWFSLDANNFQNWDSRTTSTLLIDFQQDEYKIPQIIFQSESLPVDGESSLTMNIYVDDQNAEYWLYWHFAEKESISNGSLRQFNIFLMNDPNPIGPIQLEYLKATTNSSSVKLRPEDNSTALTFTIIKDNDSSLPPILNAVEVFKVINLSIPPTNEIDVSAIMDVRRNYENVIKGWRGDPCLPLVPWDGLTCNNKSTTDPPKIITLDLSSRGLTGQILPSLFNFSALTLLNLSQNNLTGEIPEFLGEMQNLVHIDLSGNKFNGSLPIKLMNKNSTGAISLSLAGNPDLCTSKSCIEKRKDRKSVVPLIISGTIICVLLIAGVAVFVYKWKTKLAGFTNGGRLKPKTTSQFTYAQVLKVTNNFSKKLGEGAFGTVYHGFLGDGTEVAVKKLNQASALKSFQTEVELLMRIHHKNLVSFVGYCDEGDTIALFYEYMASGDLKGYFSVNTSSWRERLQISFDVAQGLEYLHDGCKPAIVHRDLKPANILLDQKLQAKIADFGMSRIFASECTNDNISKDYVVGTIGYLDPEYQSTGRLTEKSDVYSFGVIMLELITGKPAIIKGNIEHDDIHISEWIKPLLERGDIHNIIDKKLNDDFSINSAWKAVEIAMECVHFISIQRPTMAGVLADLKDCLSIEKAEKSSENYQPANDIQQSYSAINLGPSAT